jgi:hypothetical protein
MPWDCLLKEDLGIQSSVMDSLVIFFIQNHIPGDVIDLWAVVKGLKPRAAALELVTLFHLEPAPVTEKRHG